MITMDYKLLLNKIYKIEYFNDIIVLLAYCFFVKKSMELKIESTRNKKYLTQIMQFMRGVVPKILLCIVLCFL